MPTVISATGVYIPQQRKRVIDIAEELSLNIKDVERSGHQLVATANTTESTEFMAAEAAKKAIKQAQIAGADVDVIIYCGSHKDYGKWQAATAVQKSIGNLQANCFDLYQGCNSPILAVSIANALLAANSSVRHVLIVAAERWDGCTKNYSLTPSIFVGDGAAALVVSELSFAQPKDGKLLLYKASTFLSNGEFNDLWYIRGGGTNEVLQKEAPDDHLYKIRRSLDEDELSQFQTLAADTSRKILAKVLESANLTLADVSFIILMNGNARHNRHYLNSINAEDKLNSSHYLGQFGHLGGADFIVNLERMMAENIVANQAHCLVYSGGAGYSWANAIFQRQDL